MVTGRSPRPLQTTSAAVDPTRQRGAPPALEGEALDSPSHVAGRPASAVLEALSRQISAAAPVTPATDLAPWRGRTSAAASSAPLVPLVPVSSHVVTTERAGLRLPSASGGRETAADASPPAGAAPPPMPPMHGFHGGTADKVAASSAPRTPIVALHDATLQALLRRCTADAGGPVPRAARALAHTSSMPDVGIKLYSGRDVMRPAPVRTISPMRAAASTLADDMAALRRRPHQLDPLASDRTNPTRRQVPSPERGYQPGTSKPAGEDRHALATAATQATPASAGGHPRPVLMSLELPSSGMHVGPAGAYSTSCAKTVKGTGPAVPTASPTGVASGGEGSIWALGKNPRIVTSFTVGTASMSISSGAGNGRGGGAHSVAIAVPVGRAETSMRAALEAAQAAEAATLRRQSELRRLVQISRAVCAAIARKREAVARVSDAIASPDEGVAGCEDDAATAAHRFPLLLPSIALTQEGQTMMLKRVEALFASAAETAEAALRAPEAPFHGFGQDDRCEPPTDDDAPSLLSPSEVPLDHVKVPDRHRVALHVLSLLPDGPLARAQRTRTGLLPAAVLSSGGGPVTIASIRAAAGSQGSRMYDSGGYSSLLLRVMGVHLFGNADADADQPAAGTTTPLLPQRAPSPHVQPQLELHVLDLANALPPFASLTAADQRAEVDMALQDARVVAQALEAGVDMRPSMIERAAGAGSASGRAAGAIAATAGIAAELAGCDVDGSARERFIQWWGADATAPVRTAHLVRSLAMAVLDPRTTAAHAWRTASADPRMRAQLVADAVADPTVLAAAAASNLHLPNGLSLPGEALLSLLARQRISMSKAASAGPAPSPAHARTGAADPTSMFAVTGAAATFHAHPPSPHAKSPQATRSPSPARTTCASPAATARLPATAGASDAATKPAKQRPPEVDIDAAGLAIAAFAEWFECSTDPAAAEARERILVRALENASFEIARRVASAHGRKPKLPLPALHDELAAASPVPPAATRYSGRRSRSPAHASIQAGPAAATKARAAHKHAAGTAAIRQAAVECIKPPTPYLLRPCTAASLGDGDCELADGAAVTTLADDDGARNSVASPSIDIAGPVATDNAPLAPWSTGTSLVEPGSAAVTAPTVDVDDGCDFDDGDGDLSDEGTPAHSLLLDVLLARRRAREWHAAASTMMTPCSTTGASRVVDDDVLFYDDSSSDEDGVIMRRNRSITRIRQKPPSLLHCRGRRYIALAAIDASFAEAQRCVAEAERHVRALDAGSERIKAALWADTALSARDALEHGDNTDSDIDTQPRDRSLSVVLDVMRGDAKLTVAAASAGACSAATLPGVYIASVLDDDEEDNHAASMTTATCVWPLQALQTVPNVATHGAADVRGDLIDARTEALTSVMHDLQHRRCGRAAAQAAAVRTNRLRWEALSDSERAAASDHHQQARLELARRRREDIERAEHPGQLTEAERMKRAKHIATLAVAGGPAFKARARVIAEWRWLLAAEHAHLQRVRAVVVAAACLYATATGRERDARRASRAAAVAGMHAEDRWSRLREVDDARRQAEREQEVAFAFERFVPFFDDGGCGDDTEDDAPLAGHSCRAPAAHQPGPLVHELSRVFALGSGAATRSTAPSATSAGAAAVMGGCGAPAAAHPPAAIKASVLHRSATTSALATHRVADDAHARWLRHHAAAIRAAGGHPSLSSTSIVASEGTEPTSLSQLVRHGGMASAAALELLERSPAMLSPSLSSVELALPLRPRPAALTRVPIARARGGRSPARHESDEAGSAALEHARPHLKPAAMTGTVAPSAVGDALTAVARGGAGVGGRLVITGSLHPAFAEAGKAAGRSS